MAKILNRKPKITEMPDKETLEEFLAGMCGKPRVIFNRRMGKFEWVVPREEEKETEIS